jgi:sugar phosphate isomerase/epimerase
MEWQIGVRAHDFGRMQLKELAPLISSKGYGYIQLALTKALTDYQYSYGKLSTGLMRTIEKELSKNNLRVSVLGCYIDPSVENKDDYERNLEIFKEHVRFAKDVGAGMVATETGMFKHDGINDTAVLADPQFERVAVFFEEAVEEAEKAGVKIAVESVYLHTINCPETTKVLLDRIKSPAFVALFDAVNMIKPEDIANQKDVMDKVFKLYGNRINAFHLKDFELENGKMVRRSIGGGQLELEYLLKKIKEYKPFCDILLEEALPEEAEAKINHIRGIVEREK